MKTKKQSLGFTLIELILVIAIIAIIMSVTFVALDPVRRLNASRNVTRRSDVNAIADAITLKLVDTQSIGGIDSEQATWQMLGTETDCDVDDCEAGTDGVLSNNSVSFNGVNQYLETIGNDFAFQHDDLFTLTLWMKHIQGTENPLLSKNDWALSVNEDNEIEFVFGSISVKSAQTLDPLSHHHIALVFTGSPTPGSETIEIYIDGTETATNLNPVPAPNNLSLNVGKSETKYFEGNSETKYFEGNIDDIRIFNGALTDLEVGYLASGKDYNNGLISYWNFENVDSTVNDSIGGNHLSNNGGTQSSTVPPALDGQSPVMIEAACLDLTAELVSTGYLGSIPFDPKLVVGESKSYYVVNSKGANTIVRACSAEGEGVGGTGTPPFIEAFK